MENRAILSTPKKGRFYLTDAQLNFIMDTFNPIPIDDDQPVTPVPESERPTPVDPAPAVVTPPAPAVVSPKPAKTLDLIVARFPDGRYISRIPDGRVPFLAANGVNLPITIPENTETHFGIVVRRYAFFNATGSKAILTATEGNDTYQGAVALSSITGDGQKVTLSTDVVDDDQKQTASVPTGNLTPLGFAKLTKIQTS